ncbi:MAG: hypothetical protein JO257_32075 [Deltaproteobacteria bacterium]|nr:hypothetical protein [Deltaproteobacteria bacterium]
MSTKYVALALLAIAACGPSDKTRPGGGNGPDANGGGGGGGGGGGSGSDGCSDAAKLVYTVDQNNKFSQFDPSTKTFHDLGTLSCPAGFGATPFSMGVDRNTIAWVLYSDGSLYRVDIQSNLACTKTNWHSTSNLTQFGMGFSTNTSGGTDDTLFVAGGSSVGTGTTSTLAKLDTTAFTAMNVGSVNGWPELTGTGAAELWGWFPSDMNGQTTPSVQKLDKTNGHAVTTYMLPTLKGMPTAWAFAFWGGDFWIFLQKDLETSTTVYQIDGSNGSIKGMTAASGYTIVGAGVSTCAPIVIQ